MNWGRNALLYEVRWKTGDGDWIDAGKFQQARTIVLQNLVPGTVFTVSVRALGGSTGCSEWSLPVSCMAT